jgi:hypothetical protein
VTRPAHPRKKPTLRGVSTLEFVLVFPVAALLALGLVQGGLLSMGKLTLNHATFMAAREGAVSHARPEALQTAVIEGLVPFYQDSTVADVGARLREARARARAQAPAFLTVERLSPHERTFLDFGVDTGEAGRRIPNDHLRWRNPRVAAQSGVNIQDANLLKIKVTYGHELKVPLMAALVRAVMCGGGAPAAVPVWGASASLPPAGAADSDCARYYAFGRVPVTSFAVVNMQSAALAP